MALPKAIEKLSEETGGLTALQREVLSIIASPTLSSDVRHKSASLLRSLHKSYTDHKAASQESSSSDTPDIDKPSATLTPISDDEAEKIEKDVESGEVDDRVESTAVRTGEVLRVHGIYMKNPREFEIRVGEEGKLVLYDVDQKKFIM